MYITVLAYTVDDKGAGKNGADRWRFEIVVIQTCPSPQLHQLTFVSSNPRTKLDDIPNLLTRDFIVIITSFLMQNALQTCP